MRTRAGAFDSRRRLLVLLGLSAGLAGCSGLFSCEDPLQRELREKKEALATRPVTAYRCIKTALRATPMGETAAKAGPIGTGSLDRKLRQWLAPGKTAEDGSDSLVDYLALGAELRGLTSKLEALDEDDYPTLLEKILTARGGPEPLVLPFAWGSNHEHLLLALLWTGTRGAPPGLALYELEKFEAKDADPAMVKVLGPLFKALTYMRFDWPHLAERAWTDYLAELEASGAELVSGDPLSETPEQDLAWMHILGRLGRAKVRMGLEDDVGAQQDLEAAVASAERHGLDTEPTWLLGCYVALRKDDVGKATAYLGKLKASEKLGEDERALVADVEKYIAAREPGAGLRKLDDGLFALSTLLGYVSRTGLVTGLRKEVEATEIGRRMVELSNELRKLIDAFRPAAKVKGLLDKAKQGVEEALDRPGEARGD